jgi:phosphoribosylanthranilate isomerase
VPPEIKFCGMTRAEDVEAAVALGARYVGVIFAGGPRTVTIERARQLMERVPGGVGRVGVFAWDAGAIAPGDVAREIGLDVVQLHGDPDSEAVARARQTFSGAVWAAVRVRGHSLPGLAADLFQTADAVVLDAYSATSLGGTGVALPWNELADAVATVRRPGRLVLAGGLRPATVSAAVRALRPDVVDVSSGVESAPGIKDHGKLRAFRDAVRGEGGRRDRHG